LASRQAQPARARARRRAGPSESPTLPASLRVVATLDDVQNRLRNPGEHIMGGHARALGNRSARHRCRRSRPYAVWICPSVTLGAMVLGGRGSCVEGHTQTSMRRPAAVKVHLHHLSLHSSPPPRTGPQPRFHSHSSWTRSGSGACWDPTGKRRCHLHNGLVWRSTATVLGPSLCPQSSLPGRLVLGFFGGRDQLLSLRLLVVIAILPGRRSL
jgi:hypothetical protein